MHINSEIHTLSILNMYDVYIVQTIYILVDELWPPVDKVLSFTSWLISNIKYIPTVM